MMPLVQGRESACKTGALFFFACSKVSHPRRFGLPPLHNGGRLFL